MPDRAALLISCSVEEVRTIREPAKLQHRGISSYVLNILIRAVEFEERLLEKGDRVYSLFCETPRRPLCPRTTLLLRCSVQESERIRKAAKTRDTTISEYVLCCLRRSWWVESQGGQTALDKSSLSHPSEPMCGDAFGTIRPFSTDRG